MRMQEFGTFDLILWVWQAARSIHMSLWALQIFSNSEIIWENGCYVGEGRQLCYPLPVSGLLPDIGWQVTQLLLHLDPWEQLLLLVGHQWEESFGPQSKEEIPIYSEKRCQKKERVCEEKASTGEKAFKCDQCGNNFKSENGLKIHVGKAHRKVNLATPDHLRQQPKRSVSLSASPLLDTSREEPCLNSNATPPSRQLGMELEENCQTCERKLYSSMCCAEEEYICDDCCSYVLKCQNSATRKL